MAGVTISSVVGNQGIIGKTKDATSKYTQRQAEEQVALLMQEYTIDNAEKGTKLEDFLKEKKEDSTITDYKVNNDGTAEITKDGYNVTVNGNGVTGSTKVADSNNGGTSSDSSGTTESKPENLSGTAYAVYNSSSGELDFIRSYDKYENGTTETVKSISGGTYTGTVYSGIETDKYALDKQTYNPSTPWYNVRNDINKVKTVDTIKPVSTAWWFFSFYNCTSIDLANLDTSNVTDMECMFMGCTSLASLDVTNFDTSNVTNMSWMFNQCNNEKLTSLNVTNFDTSSVTNMAGMFSTCLYITSIDVSKFDTSKVTDMGGMFEYCRGLTSLDITNFNTSNVTDMSGMFEFSEGLTTIYVSDKFKTTNVTSSEDMFKTCDGLVGGAGTKWSESHVDKSYAHIDGGTSNPGYFTEKK